MTQPAEKVKEFAQETGSDVPSVPKPMPKSRVFHLNRMILSELYELNRTVCRDPADATAMIREATNLIDQGGEDYTEDDTLRASHQADAIVDMHYYALHEAAKHGINCDPVFDLVHKANMDKRDPKTGQFIRRKSDGKIIKPALWNPPDIGAELQRQKSHGSWTAPRHSPYDNDGIPWRKGMLGPSQ